MTIDDALAEIDRVKGTQLDEKLAQKFLEFVRENIDEIRQITNHD